MPDEKPKKIISDMVSVSTSVPKKTVIRETIRQEIRREYDEETVSIPSYRTPKPSRIKARHFLWIVAAACVVALVLGIGGLFSRANIQIIAKEFSGDVDASVTFTRTPQSGTFFFATASKIFSDEIIVPATGTTGKESKATGTVRFMNNNVAAKTIPAGTKILSSNKTEYQTAKSLTIPAKKGTVPGQIDGSVIAVAAGSQSNIDLDDFTFVNDKTFAGVTIRSVTAISGGASGTDSIADAAQITAATQTLQSRFPDTQTLVTRLSESLPDDMIALPIAITPGTSSIAAETNHVDGVHVVIRQTVGIVIARTDDIARIVGYDIAKGEKGSFTMKSLDGLTFIPNAAMSAQIMPDKFTARVSGTATIFGDVDLESIRTQLPGLSRVDVKKLIDAMPEIKNSHLRMMPPWRRTLPISVKDITITVK